jgi:hypothetical protein
MLTQICNLCLVERARLRFSHVNERLQSNEMDRSQFVPNFTLSLLWRTYGFGWSARISSYRRSSSRWTWVKKLIIFDKYLFIRNEHALNEYVFAVILMMICWRPTNKPWRNWFSETRIARLLLCGRLETNRNLKNKFQRTTLSNFADSFSASWWEIQRNFSFVSSTVVQLVHQLDSSRPVTLVLNKASNQDVAVSQ